MQSNKKHFVEVRDELYIYGHKNIDCPGYDNCLLQAAIQGRKFWVCNKCEHEYNFKSLVG